MSGCLYTFASVRQNLCKYIRGMRIIYILSSLLVLCLTSCAKEQPEKKGYDVCGTYCLSQLQFFSVEHVDLDGDGEESDNFLD